MRTLVISMAALLLPGLAASQPADPYAGCKTTIPAVETAGLKAMLASLQGRKANEGLQSIVRRNATVLWRCKNETSKCCNEIPVTVFAEEGACYVELPYGKLEISTDRGRKKPKLVWQLEGYGPVDPTDYEFDPNEGIRLFATVACPGPLPAAPQGHVVGNKQQFRVKSNGVKSITCAAHVPVVYPSGSVGDPLKKCIDRDPPIVNVD